MPIVHISPSVETYGHLGNVDPNVLQSGIRRELTGRYVAEVFVFPWLRIGQRG
jgi:hypothetical protein